MVKLRKSEKDKLRKAIKKKRRRLRGKKVSIQKQSILKKKKLLSLLKNSNSENPKSLKNHTQDKDDEQSEPSTNKNQNPDYVDFEDLKPEFQDIVERFIKTDREYMQLLKQEQEEDQDPDQKGPEKPQEEDPKEEKKKKNLSKRKLRKLQRIPVAQLKVLVNRPDLVESWDVTAKDPLLLMWLKSYKNTVVVPKHWSQKRKFLQNKRGRTRSIMT